MTIRFPKHKQIKIFYAPRTAERSEIVRGAFLFLWVFRFVPGYYSGAVLGYYVYCTNKLKWKPLFDGLGLTVLNI